MNVLRFTSNAMAVALLTVGAAAADGLLPLNNAYLQSALDANTNRITKLGAPVAGSDAATRTFVEEAVAPALSNIVEDVFSGSAGVLPTSAAVSGHVERVRGYLPSVMRYGNSNVWYRYTNADDHRFYYPETDGLVWWWLGAESGTPGGLMFYPDGTVGWDLGTKSLTANLSLSWGYPATGLTGTIAATNLPWSLDASVSTNGTAVPSSAAVRAYVAAYGSTNAPPADDLGNHTAEMNVDLDGYTVTNGTFAGSLAGATNGNAGTMFSAGTVPLARLSGITSGQVDTASDQAWRYDSLGNHTATGTLHMAGNKIELESGVEVDSTGYQRATNGFGAYQWGKHYTNSYLRVTNTPSTTAYVLFPGEVSDTAYWGLPKDAVEFYLRTTLRSQDSVSGWNGAFYTGSDSQLPFTHEVWDLYGISDPPWLSSSPLSQYPGVQYLDKTGWYELRAGAGINPAGAGPGTGKVRIWRVGAAYPYATSIVAEGVSASGGSSVSMACKTTLYHSAGLYGYFVTVIYERTGAPGMVQVSVDREANGRLNYLEVHRLKGLGE